MRNDTDGVATRGGGRRAAASLTLRPPLLLAFMLLALAACAALPIDGPLAKDVEAEAGLSRRLPFRLVRLQPDMLPILEESVPAAESFIADLGPDGPRLGPGDGVVMTIIEPSAGGLFSGPPNIAATGAEPGARVVTLPELSVDPDGTIAVPFVGAVDVGGLTQVEAAGRVQDALAGEAVQPQVLITAVHSVASRITVSGAVKTPGILPLLNGGERLLEAVARAGGTTEPAEHIVIQLTRFGQVHRVRLRTLLEVPETNIYVRAGDYLHLLVQPEHYLVTGAAEKVAKVSLGIETVHLAGALAEAGGLLDDRADPRAVMLFRYEPAAVMDRIAAVDARLARARGEQAPVPGTPATPAATAPPREVPPVPVVFMLDLRSASGMFMAQQLTVREEDLIYVPNSPYIQWKKLIDLIGVTSVTGTVGASAASARSF